jgi:fluoroquinolone transport system permease protein
VRGLFLQDIKFQLRHGFYLAYSLISSFYILLLVYLPEQYLEKIASLIIFSDPSTLGFFFMGGLLLLEKEQHIFNPLFITPLSMHRYICSKICSLCLLSVASSCIIKGGVFGFSGLTFLMLIGVILTSLLFSLIGIAVAAISQSLNHFFLLATIYTTWLFLPILLAIDLADHWLFYLLPTTGSLLLIDGGFHGIDYVSFLYSVCILLVSIVLAYGTAYHAFKKHIVLKIGG